MGRGSWVMGTHNVGTRVGGMVRENGHGSLVLDYGA